MKYRTDFVTNSSSSSFFYLANRLADGTEISIEDFGHDGYWNLRQGENGLENLWGSKIKNSKDLCAVLLFYNQDTGDNRIEEVPIGVLSALFSFVIGEIDSSELLEQIRLLESDTDDRNKSKTYKGKH